MKTTNGGEIDWLITIIPIFALGSLGVFAFLNPASFNEVLTRLRNIVTGHMGLFFLIFGFAFFVISIFFCFSKYGGIVIGNKDDKPAHSFFVWGCMMFTCGIAADILFYSFSEWVMYANEAFIWEKDNIYDWAGGYSLFHWGLIPWSFYLVLAVSFGFMIHNRNTKRKRFSEALRPLIGNRVEGYAGRIVDILAVFGILAGTATTFSLATPLMTSIIKRLLSVDMSDKVLSIIILLITCFVYSLSLFRDVKGIRALANACIYLLLILLAYVFLFGGQSFFIISQGVRNFAVMVTHFLQMSFNINTDSARSFTSAWTVYYWAYWIVWCVAAPFFIGHISKGRTVRQVILGGYLFGGASTVLSFSVLGNYSMGMQIAGKTDFTGGYAASNNPYEMILSVLDSLPGKGFVFILLLVLMIAFYATSFDSIAYTAAAYSYKHLGENGKPGLGMMLVWCILLIILPIVLLFSESSMLGIQSVSIVSALPLSVVIILIVVSFLKDAKGYRK